MFGRFVLSIAFISVVALSPTLPAVAAPDDSGAQKAILVTGASSGIGRSIAEDEELIQTLKEATAAQRQ